MKPKKNVETDLVGDKIGRIHLGRQDLADLQTRKMKGLKRSLEVNGEDVQEEDMIEDDIEDGDYAINGGVPLKKPRLDEK